MQSRIKIADAIYKKEKYLASATKYYNEGNFTRAYHKYKQAFKIASRYNQDDVLHGEIGMLACQFVLGSIPLPALQSTHQRLQVQLIFTDSHMRWVEEARTALREIGNVLNDPARKAEYTLDSAGFVQQDDRDSDLAVFLATVEINAEPAYKRVQYFHDILIGLEMALYFYQQQADEDKIAETKTLMAQFFEGMADAYALVLDNVELQAVWRGDGYDGVEPFSSLNAALVYYDKAIATWNMLDNAPSMDLLFSTLTIAWRAANLLDFATYREHFDIEKMISRYKIEDAIGEIEDAAELERRIQELATYDEFRQQMRDRKLHKKRPRPEGEVPIPAGSPGGLPVPSPAGDAAAEMLASWAKHTLPEPPSKLARSGQLSRSGYVRNSVFAAETLVELFERQPSEPDEKAPQPVARVVRETTIRIDLTRS